jgi:hypothetical protein
VQSISKHDLHWLLIMQSNTLTRTGGFPLRAGVVANAKAGLKKRALRMDY